MGTKALMLQQMSQGLEAQFDAEQQYTTSVLRGAKAKDAFPEFIKRKGLATGRCQAASSNDEEAAAVPGLARGARLTRTFGEPGEAR
jgi:hypothetical protein